MLGGLGPLHHGAQTSTHAKSPQMERRMEDSASLYTLPLQHGTLEPKSCAAEPPADLRSRYNKVALLRLESDSTSSPRRAYYTTRQPSMVTTTHLAAALALSAFATAQTNPEDQAFLTSTTAPTTAATAGAQTVTITATATVTQGSSTAPSITAVSDCHAHGTVK